MKKSILVLSLLLPTLAHSGTPDNTPTTTDKPAVTTTTTAPTNTDPGKTDIVAGPTATTTTPAVTTPATTTTTPVVVAPVVKAEPVLITVSTLDLKDAKLNLALNADQLQITGILPKDCADRLSLSDVTISAPSKSTDDIKSVTVKKPDDLNDYATRVEAQITFSKDDKVPSLKACIATAALDSPKVDLSKNPLFSRTALLNPDSDIAIAGIVGEPLTLKSKSILDILGQIKVFGCTTCNDTWEKLSAHLTAAKDSPFLKTIITSVFDSTLIDMDKKIEDAKSLSDLEKAADQLTQMSAFINTDDERGLQITLMEKIGAKGKELHSNHGKKITDSVAIKTVDFERDNYKKLAALSGLSDDKREEYNSLAADLSPGQQGRLQFLSSIDPNNHEIRDHLRNTDKEDKSLVADIQNKTMQMQRNCMGPMMQYNFTLCGALQNDIRSLQSQDAQLKAQDAQLQSSYTMASNDNWNGIFATWQKDGVSYDHSFFGSMIQPVKPTTQYGQGNSSQFLPQVYNPRDPQYANLTNMYSNFNGSQYFQNNMNQGSQNAFYTAQTQQGTSRPASYRPF